MVRNIKNNIKLLYWISFFNNLWFWLGIWALYYLLFTNYTGIGIIETVMIGAAVFFEIPSGALADLLGKKKTIILGLGIISLGNLTMGLALDFKILFLSAFLISLGATFLSGTLEAITYDSLKDIGQEKKYNQILSKQKSYTYLAHSLAGIIGGLLYKFGSPRLPFLAVSLAVVVAIFFAWRLKEPKTDSEKFSWDNYRRQTVKGFSLLFFGPMLRRLIPILLIVGIVYLFMYEELVDLLLVATGGTAIKISTVLVITIFISAFTVRFSKILKERVGNFKVLIFLSIVFALGMLFSVRVTFWGAVILTLLWTIIYSWSKIIQSDILNQHIPSKYRATTLSTFNLLISIPYLFMATILGWLSDLYSVQKVIATLGIVLLLGLVIGVGNFLIGERKEKLDF